MRKIFFKMDNINIAWIILLMVSIVRNEECSFEWSYCQPYEAVCQGTNLFEIPTLFYCNGYGHATTKSIEILTLTDSSEQINKIQNIAEFHNLKIITVEYTGNLREVNFNNLLDLTHLTEIKASHNKIQSIISGLGYLNDVESIDFSYNYIETIPNNCFAIFPRLKTLDLSHNINNKFNILTFEGVSNLEKIDISYNKIIEIENSFIWFVNLKELLVNNNNLTSITELNFKTTIKLQKLNLSFNQLNEIEENSFQNLPSIEELDISNNKLTKIYKNLFQNNTNMHTLSLANNPLQVIEPFAFHGLNITHLTINEIHLKGSILKRTFDGIFTDELNLSMKEISSLESEAFSGMQVRALNLSNNEIRNISTTSFTSVELLTELDLSNNKLRAIEFESTTLKQLITFSVRNNYISKLSKTTLQNLESLVKLDLSHNKISGLEPEIFLKMNKLEYLDLSYNMLANSLTSFSFKGLSSVKNIMLNNNRFILIQNNTFNGLRSLKLLNLSYCEIAKIEFDAFNNTSGLEVLDVSHNLLQNFVINSTSVATVKQLYLNDNALNNFTEKIINVEYLNLANNNIVNLKTNAFASIKNLKQLDLSSNNGIEFEDIFIVVPVITEIKVTNIKKRFDFKNVVNTTIMQLDMSYNDIDNINGVFIYKIQGVQYLNLMSNKLTFIDKHSLQRMPALKSLNLSYNLITFIQPGSFLHVNALETLNLHKNMLSALQYGVLDGLYELKTLNLSNNVIHEFAKTYILKAPMITLIALDDNVIENIKFDEFIHSEIKLITIGGNPISCHVIADIKNRPGMLNISAETLDYHSENVDGIKCVANSNFSRNVSVLTNETSVNANTAAFWIFAKAIDSFSKSVQKFSSSLESDITDKDSVQKNILNILNSIDNNTKSLAQSVFVNNNKSIPLENTKTNNSLTLGTSETNTISNVDKLNTNNELKYSINTLNEEKNKILKELHNYFMNLKQESTAKSDVQKHSDGYGDLKSVLYFVSACLTILIILSLSFIVYKILTSVKPLQRGYLCRSSRQPLDNVIELQDNQMQ